MRGHRTFEKAFLGGPTSTNDEKVLYSNKSRNCGKGAGKGKGKGQGKGVDTFGMDFVYLYGSFLLVSGQGGHPGRPGPDPHSLYTPSQPPKTIREPLGDAFKLSPNAFWPRKFLDATFCATQHVRKFVHLLFLYTSHSSSSSSPLSYIRRAEQAWVPRIAKKPY